ncbi:hypothetical protein [Phaeodactylibacter xiamenensis]|uniref:hypothetical protein n=1 Tax=Phaeodactylibacter xiamenensis TaxID=1524460 RepID=UPI003BAB75EA
MMTKCAIYTLLVMLAFSGLNAQEPSRGQWGLQAGWTESFLYDAHASPLLYHADVANISGLYRRTGAFYFELALTLSIGTNRPQQLGRRSAEIVEVPDIYGQSETYEIRAYPFISIFRGQLQARGLWEIGGHHQVGFSFHTSYVYTGLGIDTWQFTQVALGPAYQYRYPVWKGGVEAAFSLPVTSLVVRPNYAFDPSLPDETNYYFGYLRTGTQLVAFPKLFNPRFRVGYVLPLEDAKSVGAYYNMEWLSYPDPRPLRVFSHGVDLVYFF